MKARTADMMVMIVGLIRLIINMSIFLFLKKMFETYGSKLSLYSIFKALMYYVSVSTQVIKLKQSTLRISSRSSSLQLIL